MTIGAIQRENDTPIGVDDIGADTLSYRVPIAGTPSNGDSIVFSEARGAFVPASAFVAAGYGGIFMDAFSAQPDMGASVWNTVVGYDGNSLTSPRFVTQDFANNAIAFGSEGIWQLNIKITLEHDELNAGRRLALRIFNVDTATPGASIFVFATGRNVAVTNVIVGGALIQVPENAEGQLMQLQISSADVYTSVLCIGSSFEVNHISEAQGL